jgi:cytochrome c-type biogenesis protein CcmH
VALCALLVLLAGPLAGGAAALTVDEVAREVRCPTCDTPLDVSNAPVANDMKLYIAERIEQGWDKERIIDGLVTEFGPEVLTTPPKSGFDLIAWLVPAIAVALGLAAIPVLTRLWARRGSRRGGPPPTPEEERRLEERLDRTGPV